MTLWANRLVAAAVVFSSCTVFARDEPSRAGPGSYLPGTDAVRRFVSGRGVTIGIVGDSLSFPTFGSPPQVGVTHVNLGIGLVRECGFMEGLRGLYAPVGTNWLYSGAMQVWYGSAFSDSELEFSDSLGGQDGSVTPESPDEVTLPQFGVRVRFLTDAPGRIYGNFGLQNPGGPSGPGVGTTAGGTAVSAALLGAEHLQFRMLLAQSAYGAMPAQLSADVTDQAYSTLLPGVSAPVVPVSAGGWARADFDLSGLGGPFDPTSSSIRLRLRNFGPGTGAAAGDAVLTHGGYFIDPDSEGALVTHLAGGGGWNTGHHRMDTPGPDGKGYTAGAVAAKLEALEFNDPDRFRVLVIALGQNINPNGEVQGDGTTGPLYSEGVRAIVDQWIAAAAIRGCAFDQVLLLGTHPWGPADDPGEIARAKSRCDRLREVAVERGYWYIGVPYLVDPWPATNYFQSLDFHLSILGAEAYGAAIWGAFVEAAGAWPCAGDATGDGAIDFGDVVEVLSRWGEPVPYRFGPGDADGDGAVGFDDLVEVLGRWNNGCAVRTGPKRPN